MWRGNHRSFAVTLLGISVAAPAVAQLQLVSEVTGLASPVAYIQDPLASGQRFAVQQGGTLRRVLNGSIQGTSFTLPPGSFVSGGERGLLGLAFHPDHAVNGYAYIYYNNAAGDIQISRLTRSGDTFSTLTPVITIDRSGSFANHNGGTLRFGPDGYLYLGIGDGGGGNDPERNAQDPNDLQGKLLRIDVDGDDFGADPNRNYAIPTDNPFYGSNGPVQALDEIWAFGVRNPFKFSFDDANGALIIADVGQGAREEINYAAAGVGGQNYGWVKFEGTIPTPGIPSNYNLAYGPHTPPIAEYDHNVGSSITGGYVYRGNGLGPAYQGRYFYADYISRKLFSMEITIGPGGVATSGNVIDHTAEVGGSAFLGNVTSIDVDQSGELFLVSYNGTVRRLTAVPEPGTIAVLGLGSLGLVRRWRRRGQSDKTKSAFPGRRA